MAAKIASYSRLLFVLLLITAASGRPQTPESFGFDVLRGGEKIGTGTVTIQNDGDRKEVDYRVAMTVRLAFVPVYSQHRHQFAVFNSNGTLQYARSSMDNNGQDIDVEVCSRPDDIEIRRGNSADQIKPGQYIMTTLNPLFQTPRPGQWLDLARGTVVQYQVEEQGGQFVLLHGSEVDRMVKGADGVVRDLAIQSSRGTVELRRAGAMVERPEARFEVRDAVERSRGCGV